MKRYLSGSGLPFLVISVLILIIDRLSKLWVVSHLSLFEPVYVLPIFNLTLAYNRGAAFSFLHSASGWQNILLGSFAVLVSIGVVIWLSQVKRNEYWQNTALAFILAGAMGNAWDRALYGYVTDFLDFHWNDWHFAIFNFADSSICIGAVMISLMWVMKKG